MARKVITYIKYPVLVAGILLCLVGVAYAATSNIDPTDKWAWSKNVGWVNFAPDTHGGVTVYADHLEGYAWSKNVGWINFNLGGDEGVTIDPATGSFDGYAWAENVGWIHFKGTGDIEYNVFTTWRGVVGGWCRCAGAQVAQGLEFVFKT